MSKVLVIRGIVFVNLVIRAKIIIVHLVIRDKFVVVNLVHRNKFAIVNLIITDKFVVVTLTIRGRFIIDYLKLGVYLILNVENNQWLTVCLIIGYNVHLQISSGRHPPLYNP